MLKHIIVLVLCFMPYIIGNLGDKTPLDYLGEVQRFVECYATLMTFNGILMNFCNKNEIRCSTIKNKTGISIENSGLCPDATKTNALKNKFTQEFDQVMDSTQFISLINKCKSNTSDQSNPLNTFVHNYDWLKNDKVSTCCIQYSQRTPKSLGI
ncbi:uncharacterized protein LOC115034951 [Acyrthosiphon pisum]|uniref:Uncharacterized protein n=1 Tax=Acyrthosiphon pisum TaxID=7029 RepID=C4WTT6_ACYPI|nr:uncharacterized protein LOC100571631 precursor [Acyrthosiphon pisum]XP_029348397.1 uncharacterized protein LOC115034951 [Acyrthosiphon pisum]BAH71306.1 hypothetical protein [Acyrthosiphon pisum]|eukprot:NP_001233103.1 uncharacterized protein LOC100571631 precursor [Acyrthosiphon pisum]